MVLDWSTFKVSQIRDFLCGGRTKPFFWLVSVWLVPKTSEYEVNDGLLCDLSGEQIQDYGDYRVIWYQSKQLHSTASLMAGWQLFAPYRVLINYAKSISTDFASKYFWCIVFERKTSVSLLSWRQSQIKVRWKVYSIAFVWAFKTVQISQEIWDRNNF